MIPVVIKPKVWAVRNRWRYELRDPRRLRQHLCLILFCGVIISLIFIGTLKALQQLQLLSSLAYLSPSRPLALLLLPLSLMLVLSAAVIAIGTLFYSRDLDLLLAAPLAFPSFFMGKYLYVLITAAWMPFIFMAPVLTALGVSYHAGLEYYLAAPLLSLPYFIIYISLGMVLAPLVVILIPPHRTKEILLALLLSGLIAVAMWIDLFEITSRSFSNTSSLLRLISLLSMPHLDWLPSNWLANSLEQALTFNRHKGIWLEATLLYCTAASLGSLAYLILESVFARAFSRCAGVKREIRSHPLQRGILRFLPDRFCHWTTFALLAKDFKVYTRDTTHMLQIALLIGICAMYLYHLQIFAQVRELPENMRIFWQMFLLVGNIAVGAFAMTAVCTRFAFPSISLEGSAFWMISSSPLALTDLIRNKFHFWLVPTILLSVAFLGSSSYILGMNWRFTMLSILAAIIVSYGVVGLAVGLGAYFADFDWEHPSQLAAGFGSLIFMLLGVGLILTSLVPITTIALMVQLQLSSHTDEPMRRLVAAAALIAAATLNYLIARLALRAGRRKLSDKAV